MTFPEPYFQKNPRPDLEIVSPDTLPVIGQIVVGYMIHDRPDGCLVVPRPSRLSDLGWISAIVLAIVFWPVSCVPCCLGGFYNGYQVPVFDYIDGNNLYHNKCE
jgi:nitrate reductase NapE component